MMKRAFRGISVLLAVLAALVSAAAAEGYMMVFSSLRVYGDREMTAYLGEIRDASVIYVSSVEEGEKGPVYTVAFGDHWILRTGYASGGSLMPLMPMEAEAYALEAADGMRYSEEVRLLNADFVPAEKTSEKDEASAPTTPQPAETASPAPTVRVTPSPLPTVTPKPTPAATATLPPTPTKNPASCVSIVIPPTDVSGFSGEEVVLAVGATGAASYQWQYFDGYRWVDSVMEQAASPAMKLVVFEGERERIYRCVIRGTDGTTVYTEPVRIIVQK